MSSLKESLAESGVNVGQINVSVSSDENETMRAYERERQKSAKRISKIIQDAQLAEQAVEAVDITEEAVAGAQVSYTA